MRPILHFIMDPLCGWCYAAEPLLDAVSDRLGDRIDIQVHGGGLFTEERLSASMREHIRAADARIAQLSGQSFGEAYLNGVLADSAACFDSTPPITAVLAANALEPSAALTMLKAIQHAHYREGRRVVEPAVLGDIAASLGFELEAFQAAYLRHEGETVQHHIHATRSLMAQCGVQGFPAFILQWREALRTVPHQAWYGQPAGFVDLVEHMLQEHNAVAY